jgi:hypothetical protein
MEPIRFEEIKNLHEYELIRNPFRSDVIEVKRRRRISVGPLVTLVFENRTTVLFQIQEMLRAERIAEPAKVQDEIDVYNSLLPGPGEIAATLFIEVTEEARVKPVLDSFIGLDEGRSLWLESGGRRFFAKFEEGHGREDKISAVHYVRFVLDSEGREALLRTRAATLRLEHGTQSASVTLSPETIDELLGDLSTP